MLCSLLCVCTLIPAGQSGSGIVVRLSFHSIFTYSVLHCTWNSIVLLPLSLFKFHLSVLAACYYVFPNLTFDTVKQAAHFLKKDHTKRLVHISKILFSTPLCKSLRFTCIVVQYESIQYPFSKSFEMWSKFMGDYYFPPP